jgi:hypothetical protein
VAETGLADADLKGHSPIVQFRTLSRSERFEAEYRSAHYPTEIIADDAWTDDGLFPHDVTKLSVDGDVPRSTQDSEEEEPADMWDLLQGQVSKPVRSVQKRYADVKSRFLSWSKDQQDTAQRLGVNVFIRDMTEAIAQKSTSTFATSFSHNE